MSDINNTPQTDHLTTAAILKRACQDMPTMTASDFYRITGIKNDTVRKARYRARRRGKPVPVPMFDADTYNVDLRKAITWLMETSRYGAIARLQAHFDDVLNESMSMMRGVRTVHSRQNVRPIDSHPLELHSAAD